GDEADPHPGALAGVLRGSERAVREPLQENVERNLAGMGFDEVRDLGAFGIAPGARPLAPVRRFAIRSKAGCVQGLEARMPGEKLSPFRDEAFEIGRECPRPWARELEALEAFEERAKKCELGARRARPIDQVEAFELAHRALQA